MSDPHGRAFWAGLSARWLGAATCGGLIGLCWWLLYLRAPYSPGVFIGVHALAATGWALGLSALGAAARLLLGDSRSSGLRRMSEPTPLAVSLVASLGLTNAILLSWLGRVGSDRLASERLGSLLVLVGLVGGAALAAWLAAWPASRPKRIWTGLLVVALAIGLLAVRSEPDATGDAAVATVADVPDFDFAPTLVYGIDGGDWRVVEPMIERGELPHLAALRARGRSGVLQSLEPMYSPTVWTSIFSSRTPVEHGVSDWVRSDSTFRRVPVLWEILADQQKSSLVINVPGSWPAVDRPGLRLLSGFPIPGMGRRVEGQFVGHLVGEPEPDDFVPTRELVWTGTSGAFRVPWRVDAGELRFGPHNALMTTFVHRDWWPVVPLSVEMSVEQSSAGLDSVAVSLPIAGGEPIGSELERRTGDSGLRFELRVGEWSPWLRVHSGERSAWLRLRRLADRDGSPRFYATPSFQDPARPAHPFAAGVDSEGLFTRGGAPYVPEPLGWTVHRDPRAEWVVPEIGFEVEAGHAEIARRLLRERLPELLVYVFTTTDRFQHAYWALHDPTAYPSFVPPAAALGKSPVEDAYREADRILGELLAEMPTETHVWVVSDHGVEAIPGQPFGESGHRPEGLWLAAGPTIDAADESLELSVLDVMPSVLHCAGAPVAREFSGTARVEVCAAAGEVRAIESYGGGSETQPRDRSEQDEVDPTQLEQIKSLGYMS